MIYLRVIGIHQIRYGMHLAQNIYRHDSLLSLPKGTKIFRFEKDILFDNQLDYILIEDGEHGSLEDIRYTLGIIESVYIQNSLWDKEFGKALFEQLERRIIKNKKIQLYLNELRQMDSFSFVQSVNDSVIVGLLLQGKEKMDLLVEFVLLALIHDIGKIKMKTIISKAEKLTDDEYKELRKHPEYSYQLLKKAGIEEEYLRSVYEHHERYDGTGYPMRIGDDQIHELAQIILIADTYNALSSRRPYREAFMPYQVLQMIQEEKGKAFGESFVDFFMDTFRPYRVGTMVELNDGSEAIVVKVDPNHITLPVVKVQHESMENPLFVDLKKNQNVRITRIIQNY